MKSINLNYSKICLYRGSVDDFRPLPPIYVSSTINGTFSNIKIDEEFKILLYRKKKLSGTLKAKRINSIDIILLTAEGFINYNIETEKK